MVWQTRFAVPSTCPISSSLLVVGGVLVDVVLRVMEGKEAEDLAFCDKEAVIGAMGAMGAILSVSAEEEALTRLV